MFKFFKYSFFFFLFFENIFSLQISSQFFSLKKERFKGVDSKVLQGYCEARAMKLEFLKEIEENFKKVLLSNDSKKFDAVLTEMLRVLSVLDLAQVLYDIFSTAPMEDAFEEERGECLLQKQASISLVLPNGLYSHPRDLIIKQEKNIYVSQFDYFMINNKEWSHFKNYFLAKVSNLKIVVYLLENSCLSYPLLAYLGKDRTFLKECLAESFLNPSKYCFGNLFFSRITITGQSTLISLKVTEEFFPSLSIETQEGLDSIINAGILSSMGVDAIIKYHENNKPKEHDGVMLPAFLKLSFFAKRDGWKQFENKMDTEVTDPVMIEDLLKKLMKNFPLVLSLVKASAIYQFKIKSLWMGKDCNKDGLFYIIFKIEENFEGDPSLEFFKEKKEIIRRVGCFLNRNPDNPFYALIAEFLSGKFLRMQVKDFSSIIVNCLKKYFSHLYDSYDDDDEGDIDKKEIESSEWKELVKEEDFWRTKEKMELIYQQLPCESEEEWELKKDFFHMLSSVNSAFLEEMCVDAGGALNIFS